MVWFLSRHIWLQHLANITFIHILFFCVYDVNFILDLFITEENEWLEKQNKKKLKKYASYEYLI